MHTMAKNIIIPMIKEDSYTLYGTRLTPRNNQDPVTGYWANTLMSGGMWDNMGSDNLVGGNVIDGSGQRNGFKIANAIYHDGTPVKIAIYRLYQSSVWSIIEKVVGLERYPQKYFHLKTYQ